MQVMEKTSRQTKTKKQCRLATVRLAPISNNVTYLRLKFSFFKKKNVFPTQ